MKHVLPPLVFATHSSNCATLNQSSPSINNLQNMKNKKRHQTQTKYQPLTLTNFDNCKRMTTREVWPWE